MSWILLVAAGLLEIVWAVALKYSEGFTRPWPTAITIAGLAGSMVLLAAAAKALPIGTAYAVWVGIGAAGTAAIGIVFLGEPAGAWRLFFLALLVVAVLGLKLTAAR